MADVAVTGASGFIGSAVVRQLLAGGREVRALVEPGANLANLEGLNVERVTVDVCDFERMRRALDGCESLYHLAAIYKLWVKDRAPIHKVNNEGTTVTLLAAQAARVKRIVYTSSIAAIGVPEGKPETDETQEWNLFDIANDYILTKWQSERIALRFAEAGMDLVVVNPAFPFGPRDIAPTPTGKLILGVLRGEYPAAMPGGVCTIDVDDCAAGHLLAEAKGRRGERYILGDHNVTLKDLLVVVGKVAGVKVPQLTLPKPLALGYALGVELWSDWVTHEEPLATFRSLRYATKNVFFDCTKAKRELGLPGRPLEESVRRAVEYFRGAGVV